MRKIVTFALFATMAGSAIGLYQVKGDAARMEAGNSELRAKIDRAQKDIAVLRAEWSYLNDPDRLQDLASRHLGLERMNVLQIAKTGDIPMRQLPAQPLNQAQLNMLIEQTVTMTGSVKKKGDR